MRSFKGKLEDRKPVSDAASLDTKLLNFEHDGKRGDEIGVAYEDKKGTGHFTVWGRSGKKLKLLADHAVIPTGTATHQWLPLDVDGDGTEEIAATYAGASGKGATLRILDPRTGKMLVNKRVLKTSFDQPVWTPGEFDTSAAGRELLVGYRKKTSALFKVFGGDGKEISKGTVAGKVVVQAWGAVESRPGPKGTVRDLVFVGITRSDGSAAFEVWDPSKKKAKRLTSTTVASSDFAVLGWKIGNFDGNADNGLDVVAVTRHLGDRNVGIQMFSSDGKSSGVRMQVFDGTYIGVSATPGRFVNKGRTDLALVGRTLGGIPEVQIWNVNGGVLLKKFTVLSKDVE